ncbi:PfkB family carbohydrate kinase [Enterococcus sp. 2201sp1_2201st1_B8_2201SCRN_220225]|uniref:PfkB family carbohydrate kinase n=1 Tax=unclassified Enterococcus TaxID=2608891 RepID=UPI0034A27208
MNIKDIATLAGVSASTVSKIINKKDTTISQETRERVLKIVKEYNYTPYSSMISTQKRSWILGILLNSSVALDSSLDGILKEAQKAGYSTLVLNNYGDPEQELKNITMLCKANIDGIIWDPVSDKSLNYKYLLDELNIPIQTIGINGGNDSLLLPYEEAAYKMTTTLIENGHKYIACLAPKSQRKSVFTNGYFNALFDHHLKLNDEHIFQVIDDELLHLINTQEVTGIVISHYLHAIELCTLLNNSAIRIPDNFSIVSIQNDDGLNTLTNSHIKVSSLIIKNADFGKFICHKLICEIERKKLEVPFFVDNLKIDSFATIGKPYDLHAPKVLVIGSINIDTYLNTPDIPKEGGTTILSNISNLPGGKGLNQAIGVAKLGQHANLIGKIGNDLDSDRIFKELEANGISTSGIIRTTNNRTGRAYIFVQSNGESMISILPGANNDLSPEDLDLKLELFQDTAYCLLQNEIPLDTIERACDLAHEYGSKTILKPSINQQIPDRLWQKIDILIPNEKELRFLCPNNKNIDQMATTLCEKGVSTIIVTLGKNGSFLKTKLKSSHFDSSEFPAIDTTGAGDAFISALASYLMYGYDIDAAIKIATHAAGFSISRDGVVTSLIDKQTLDSYVSRHNQ